jgi:regulator of RNase E activity RraA
MDADGAITVRPSRLDEILEKAEARAAKEAVMRERHRNGERSYDLRGWRDLVEAPP